MRLSVRDQGQASRCPQRVADRADEPAGNRRGRYRTPAQRPQPLSGGRVPDAGHRSGLDPDAGPLSGLRAVGKRSLPALEIASLTAAGPLVDAKVPGTDL